MVPLFLLGPFVCSATTLFPTPFPPTTTAPTTTTTTAAPTTTTTTAAPTTTTTTAPTTATPVECMTEHQGDAKPGSLDPCTCTNFKYNFKRPFADNRRRRICTSPTPVCTTPSSPSRFSCVIPNTINNRRRAPSGFPPTPPPTPNPPTPVPPTQAPTPSPTRWPTPVLTSRRRRSAPVTTTAAPTTTPPIPPKSLVNTPFPTSRGPSGSTNISPTPSPAWVPTPPTLSPTPWTPSPTPPPTPEISCRRRVSQCCERCDKGPMSCTRCPATNSPTPNPPTPPTPQLIPSPAPPTPNCGAKGTHVSKFGHSCEQVPGTGDFDGHDGQTGRRRRRAPGTKWIDFRCSWATDCSCLPTEMTVFDSRRRRGNMYLYKYCAAPPTPPTPPTPLMPAPSCPGGQVRNRYTALANGTCGADGITTLEECNTAFTTLNLPPSDYAGRRRTAKGVEGGSDKYPSGCYFLQYKGKDDLTLNLATSAVSCTHVRKCICSACGAPTPTPAPEKTTAPTRAPTRAPTPTPTFLVNTPKLVVHTQLAGFTVATFTRGVRWAYRLAFARRYGIADMLRVIITNIRVSGGSARRLGSADELSRALAAAAVEFDIQVASNTTAEATALSAEVKGGNATEEAALVADFKTELATVASEGTFPLDVPANYEVPAAVAVVTEAGQVALETGAPTPAPTPAEGSASLPIPIIAGAAAAVAVVAAVAVRRAKLNQAATTTRPMPADSDGLQMADIYPGAGGGKLSDRAQKEEASSVL